MSHSDDNKNESDVKESSYEEFLREANPLVTRTDCDVIHASVQTLPIPLRKKESASLVDGETQVAPRSSGVHSTFIARGPYLGEIPVQSNCWVEPVGAPRDYDELALDEAFIDFISSAKPDPPGAKVGADNIQAAFIPCVAPAKTITQKAMSDKDIDVDDLKLAKDEKGKEEDEKDRKSNK